MKAGRGLHDGGAGAKNLAERARELSPKRAGKVGVALPSPQIHRE